jgi:F0F1-type ATP synthase beta subunit
MGDCQHRCLHIFFLKVAEVFTGTPGKLVPLKETIKGFKMLLNGKKLVFDILDYRIYHIFL